MQFLLTRAWDDRAMRAYFRHERGRTHHSPDQPTKPDTYADGRGGHIVVLSNCNGVLSMYAVKADRLRRIEPGDWPGDVVALYEGAPC